MANATAQDGTTLDVDVQGDGPDVVLIHGWPLSHAMWSRQKKALV